MGAALTPEKCISVSKSGIILGRKVASFFKTRGTILVNIILNYNNNSLIISDTGLRENILLNHVEQGLKINYEKETYHSNTNIKLTQLIKFLNIDYITVFKAKPFRGNSIIIENIPLLELVSLRNKMAFINMKLKLIMFGNFKLCKTIKLEDVMPITSSVQNKLTTTPYATKTVSNNHNSAQVVNKVSQNHIVNKETGSYEVDNTPSANSPTPDELERVDKAYARMILGE